MREPGSIRLLPFRQPFLPVRLLVFERDPGSFSGSRRLVAEVYGEEVVRRNFRDCQVFCRYTTFGAVPLIEEE